MQYDQSSKSGYQLDWHQSCMATRCEFGGTMKIEQEAIRVPLQVGATLRIRNNGEIIVDNPELELAADTTAADAVLSYQFDSKAREHILRLLDPLSDHIHLRAHRRDD